MMGLPIKAVIFDLDGLVLDSETTYISAWRQAAAAMGYTLSEAFCRSLSGLHGVSVERQLQQQCGGDFDVDRFKRLSGEYWSSQVRQHGIPVKKGFFALLNIIQQLNLPYCLGTNSRRREAMQCLELAGLPAVFSLIVARDDVPNGKPAPDIFIQAAEVLGMATGECLVLEDSPVGVAAAVAAGAPCIYVPSLYPLDDRAAADAVAVMDDLEQVAGYLFK
jgi:beta-phosphoglucomutase-like phosphatase (HAD superfamily)